MSFREFIKLVQDARTYVRWLTLSSAVVAVVSDYIVEMHYVSYTYYVQDNSPLALRRLLGLSLLMSFALGLFTFPRWYSFIALISVVWIVLCISGR